MGHKSNAMFADFNLIYLLATTPAHKIATMICAKIALHRKLFISLPLIKFVATSVNVILMKKKNSKPETLG